MKKIVACFSAFVLVLSVSACVPTSNPNVVASANFEFPELTLSEPVTLANLEVEKTRAIAGRLMWEHYSKQPTVPVTIKHVISPTFPVAVQKDALNSYQMAANFYGTVADVSKASVLWFTMKDAGWINDAACKEANYCPDKTPYFDYAAQMRAANDCHIGGEQWQGDVIVVGECWTGEFDNEKHHQAKHAYTHFVQLALEKGKRYDSWWIEGTPTLVDNFLSAVDYKNLGEYTLGVAGASYMWRDQTAVDLPEKLTEKDYVRIFDVVEGKGGIPSWNGSLGYYLGALCSEALIATYGVDVFINNFKLIGEVGFERAFNKSFGLSTAEFRKKVLPYVMARHQLDIKLLKEFEANRAE